MNAGDERKQTALHAAWHGHVDAEKVLIQNGADVNAVAVNKWTALDFTGWIGYVDVAKVLIQNGVDVNAVHNKDKRTALHFAAGSGRVDFMKVLIQNGADECCYESERDSTSPRK